MGILFLYSLFTLLANTLLLSSVDGLGRLNLGDSLSADRKNDVLFSRNMAFSAGFINVGTNAFCFSVWFTRPENKTVVWMANRDQPVPKQGSMIRLRKYGALDLLSGSEGKIWEVDAAATYDVKALELLESGNLVLKDGAGRVVWESFASPTDTLLPNQQLTRNTTLVSNRAAGSYLSGFYTFKFNDDNVLYLTYSGPEASSIYWPRQDRKIYDYNRTNFNSSRLAAMDEMGSFYSSDSLTFTTSDYGKGPLRRLTLDQDGVLRAYSLNNFTGLWEVVWLPPVRVCDVDGLCGAYGICFYAPEPTCSCPPRFVPRKASDWSQGCVPEFNLSCNQTKVDFLRLPHTDYYGYDLDTFQMNATLKDCREICEEDCRCVGFGFKNKMCFPKFVLLNGRRGPGEFNTIYIKVPAALAAKEGEDLALIASNANGLGIVLDTSRRKKTQDRSKNLYLRYLVGFVGALGVMESVVIFLGFWFVGGNRLGPLKRGYRLQQAMGFRRFTYKELKKATASFREEIGRGGFGTVYKGLVDGGKTVVAVKRLEGLVQGETEFWAEVSVIGRINHMNLVSVCGFCAEGKHRLLVYEFLEKGSLDKLLFASDAGEVLDWEKRYSVALGTAMGLAYLHEECLEWVLHCDVKPQNILLDNSFRPKLADFGMSRLSDAGSGGDNARRVNLEVSRARGTRGYMAPEWLANQDITAKVDVYSYGVVLLELVTGRSASGIHGESNQLLISWVLEKVKERNGVREALEELVDQRLQGNYDIVQAELLLRVALLCVKISKDERPAMSAVVGLLLGDEDSPWSP